MPAASPSPAAQVQQAAGQPRPHLAQLSEEQLEAVMAPLGTVRVVAGPGSGKVRWGTVGWDLSAASMHGPADPHWRIDPTPPPTPLHRYRHRRGC